MPKLTIDLPKDVNEKLKKKAKEDYRSLTNYITIQLIKLANDEIQQYQPQQTNSQIIDLSALPEGTTIKTKATRPLTPEEIEEQQKQSFLSLCEDMYGKKFYNEYKPDIIRTFIALTPDQNEYYKAAEPIEGKFTRAVYTMPQDMQEQYIAEMKPILESGDY